jgi:hypothetical protein
MEEVLITMKMQLHFIQVHGKMISNMEQGF